MTNLRLAAARVIDEVTNGRSLSDCLPAQLSKIAEPRDKAFVQAICYGVCRYYLQLDAVLGQLLQKPMKAKDSDVHALLMVGLYQLMQMHTADHAAVSETVNAVEGLKKPWARGLVNAVLREYLRQKASLPEKIKDDEEALYAHPRWWITLLKQAWPDHWQNILEASNQHPPFTVRVNQLKISREQYLQKLSDAGIAAHLTDTAANGIVIESPLPAEQLPGFHEGMVSVQDAAAQLAAELLDLKPDERILDACAAPGGKLTHILELQKNLDVTAIEVDKVRMQLVQENLGRLQLCAKTVVADASDVTGWWDGKPFDRILLDAPCSASGVVRRHPDIKLLRQLTDIKALPKLQRQILDALWQTLKPDGVLVYATCSVFPQENSQLVSQFLQDHADAQEQKLDAGWGLACDTGRQIFPGDNEMDGFYYAVLRKRGA